MENTLGSQGFCDMDFPTSQTFHVPRPHYLFLQPHLTGFISSASTLGILKYDTLTHKLSSRTLIQLRPSDRSRGHSCCGLKSQHTWNFSLACQISITITQNEMENNLNLLKNFLENASRNQYAFGFK